MPATAFNPVIDSQSEANDVDHVVAERAVRFESIDALEFHQTPDKPHKRPLGALTLSKEHDGQTPDKAVLGNGQTSTRSTDSVKRARSSRHPSLWHRKRGHANISDFEAATYAAELNLGTENNPTSSQVRDEAVKLLVKLDEWQVSCLRKVYTQLWIGDSQPYPDDPVWSICQKCWNLCAECSCRKPGDLAVACEMHDAD